jgi:hypothetical protein
VPYTEFFEAGGVLPWLAGVAAFGAGVGIGNYICVEVLDWEGSCLFYSSTEEASIETSEGSWSYSQKPPAAAEILEPAPWGAYWWCYSTLPCGQGLSYTGLGGIPKGEGIPQPLGLSGYTRTHLYESGGTAGDYATSPYRSPSGGHDLAPATAGEAAGGETYSGSGYCPVVGPGSTECLTQPPSNWPERLGTCLSEPAKCGLTEKQRDEIGEHIAGRIPKSGVSDPWALTVAVPDCTGMKATPCKEAVEEIGLDPEVDHLDWKTADLEKEANEVVELIPDIATIVEKGSTVKIVANPGEEGMPEVIPDIKPGETYGDYAARLSPGLHPTRVNVTEANQDPSEGPNVALRTQPAELTREAPGSDTDVDVYTNPPDAAAVLPAGSCDASVGAIDWSPLNKGLGSRFPFGVVGFFAGWVGSWGEPGAPPAVGVHLTDHLVLHISLAFMEPAMPVVRVAFIFLTFVGFLYFLGTAAMNLRGDAS